MILEISPKGNPLIWQGQADGGLALLVFLRDGARIQAARNLDEIGRRFFRFSWKSGGFAKNDHFCRWKKR